MSKTIQPRYESLDEKLFPKKIWEMHPQESTVAFNYFATYRDMGFGKERSRERCAALLGISKSALDYYASPCRWEDRVKAHDAYIDVEVGKEKIKALKAMKKKHIDSMRATSSALMLPIVELLKRSNNGSVQWDDLKLKELLFIVNQNASVLTKVIDGERKANDQPNEIVDNKYSDGVPNQVVVIKPESTDRIKAVLEQRKQDLESE